MKTFRGRAYALWCCCTIGLYFLALLVRTASGLGGWISAILFFFRGPEIFLFIFLAGFVLFFLPPLPTQELDPRTRRRILRLIGAYHFTMLMGFWVLPDFDDRDIPVALHPFMKLFTTFLSHDQVASMSYMLSYALVAGGLGILIALAVTGGRVRRQASPEPGTTN
ncbi:MAG: hypothetical protein Q4D85_14415 [Corynebacterium sp.]|uniref:hypothetical protein n=1 Tax=Corynebacterium sp. TaxID=1720 RepID=UPI0026DCFD0F|nr:hypothetical protein [Corynebacterium sp.]MDO5099926.1 hypothetical protein [Corynebacterium sp.]